MAAEAQGIANGVIDLLLRRSADAIVQITFLIGFSRSDCLMDETVLDAPDTDNEFHPTRCAQQMAGHGFCRIDFHAIGGFSERQFNRLCLCQVIEVGSGSMGIDISTCSGVIPASFMARDMACAAPSPSSDGAVMW